MRALPVTSTFFTTSQTTTARSSSLRSRSSGSRTCQGIAGAGELSEPGAIFQFGVPPNRIDLLNGIDGVTFVECWGSRIEVQIQSPEGLIPVPYIGLKELIKNKAAAGRDKDVDDLRFLKRVGG